MSPRLRLATCLSVLSVVAIACVPRAGAKDSAAASARSHRCAAALESPAPTALARPGSTSDTLLAQFAALRRVALPFDALLSAHLATAVTAGGGAAYDPNRVRLLVAAGGILEFIVPATLDPGHLGLLCAHTPLAAPAQAIQIARNLRGAGPGICLISTTYTASCESDAVLDGFGGIDSTVTGPAQGHEFLVPDGVTDVQMTYASGRTELVPVFDNLALPPSTATLPSGIAPAALATALQQDLPTSISWLGPRRSDDHVFGRPAGFAAALQHALSAVL